MSVFYLPCPFASCQQWDSQPRVIAVVRVLTKRFRGWLLPCERREDAEFPCLLQRGGRGDKHISSTLISREVIAWCDVPVGGMVL